MALIDDVTLVCDRLAPLGWRDLLLDVTGGDLDISTSNLKAELTKTLSSIKRTHPGFEDFAEDADRAIARRSPARSLLYHALASPLVVSDPQGVALQGFPTLKELDDVENFIFGANPPTIQEVLNETGENELSIVVLAFEYRPARDTCSRRRAEMVFSRTGVSRVGTAAPQYDGVRRGFWPEDASNPRSIRVTPSRFAAYLAAPSAGIASEFVPMRFQPNANSKSDANRRFWIPVHKLFDGKECLKGLNLTVKLTYRALAGSGNIRQKRNAIYVLSFRRETAGSPELQQALQDTGTIVGSHVFRIDMSMVNQVQDQPVPFNHRKRRFPIVGRRLVFVDPENGRVMHKADGQPAWSRILG